MTSIKRPATRHPETGAGPARKPEWLVSYAWGDDTDEGRALDNAVNDICAAAEQRGLHILRDRNELALGDSISDFMRRIGDGDRVFVILSTKYLRSWWCMFELFEIWQNAGRRKREFLGKVRVFVLPDARTTFDTIPLRFEWARFWKNQYDEIDTLIRTHGLDVVADEDILAFRRMGEFYRNVGNILATIADIVQSRTLEQFVAYGFADPRNPNPRPNPAVAPPLPAPPTLPSRTAGSWATDTGEDAHGRWATFTIPGRNGARVAQRLRWSPPGRFLMGSPTGEEGRYNDEGPQHEVTLATGFWLFDTPCTQALWEAVMGDNPSNFKTPTRPVETVSFEQAQAFLGKLNAQVPGLDLVLPSEAQWEYACRAGTATATYAGAMRIVGEHNAPVLDAIAWYGGNSGVGFELENGYDSSDWPQKQYDHKRAGTRPVGLKEPNPWGLYDMLGNVWEWCADHWHETYDGAPADGSAWVDPTGAANRVIRGGSWHDDARGVRAAFRNGLVPSFRADVIGFRCARVQER